MTKPAKNKTITGVLNSRATAPKMDGDTPSQTNGKPEKYREWYVKPFTHIDQMREDMICGRDDTDEVNIPLPDSGTLMTVFNTISKGTVAWEGTVDLEKKRRFQPYPMNPAAGQQEVFGMWVHGFDKKSTPEEWASMFFTAMPAKMERDGKEIHGALEPYFETGTEGVIWSLHEYGKDGYDGLNCLQDGDKLTVYSDVTDGNIAWQGALSFDVKEQKVQIYPSNPHITEKTHRVPNGIDREDWARMTSQHYPAKFEQETAKIKLKPTVLK